MKSIKCGTHLIIHFYSLFYANLSHVNMSLSSFLCMFKIN